MKRNLILIFMCAVGCIAHAQDMIVTFMNDSATITIGGTTYDSKHEIKLCKEINSSGKSNSISGKIDNIQAMSAYSSKYDMTLATEFIEEKTKEIT